MLVAEVKPDRVKLTLGDESEELLLRVGANPRADRASRRAPPVAAVPQPPRCSSDCRGAPDGAAAAGAAQTLAERRRAARAAAAANARGRGAAAPGAPRRRSGRGRAARRRSALEQMDQLPRTGRSGNRPSTNDLRR